MSDDLNEVPVEDIKVETKTSTPKSKMETDEFYKQLNELFSSGPVWRSSTTLAQKLEVDVIQLDKYLRTQQAVVSRAAKEEGVFLYAFVKRLPEEEKKDKKLPHQKLAGEEDRYALGCIHSAFLLFESSLKKYALNIHEKSPEAFTQLVVAKEKMKVGILLFGTILNADIKKLPGVD
jgi:hypothetical protein